MGNQPNQLEVANMANAIPLQVDDVVEVVSKRKVGTRSVAAKIWDEGDVHYELNYWIIRSMEDCYDLMC